MIQYIKGNILESNAQALVNTVNTQGVMGKGIALQFKNAFPANFRKYVAACKNKSLAIGTLLITLDSNLNAVDKLIINFPTKEDWRKPSEYSYIERGLNSLSVAIQENNIKSIAIPPLGAGNGGLKWEKVRQMIEEKLSGFNDVNIYIYEPTTEIREVLKKERARLTDGRALLLYVLYDLIRHGEYVSEFSSEKACYFLQKFGGKKYLNLNFTPHFYGPYSGKVRYVLNALNGSYVMGYSAMDKKPFAPLTLVADGYDDVIKYISNNEDLKDLAYKTTAFLEGFYSDFTLELLSSVDYLIAEHGNMNRDETYRALSNWNNRKRSVFSNLEYIDIILSHLQTVDNKIYTS